MYNDWFTIGPVTVHGYGVMIAIGILAAFWLAEKLAKRHDLDEERIDTFIFFVIIFGYMCSKMLYCITVFDQFLSDPLSVLGSGGWVVYGGVLGGIFGAWLFCKKYGWDFMHYFNVLIPCVALAQGFGRIGCFFAGCCYGIETDSAIGVHFPAGSLCPVDHAVIPTQLIMSLGDFIIFAILYYNLKKGKGLQNNASLYLMLYSAGRFAVEFIRGDINRGFVGVLSTSQFISIFAFLLGFYLFMSGKNKKEEKNTTLV